MPEALTPDPGFTRKLTEIVLANLENENFGVNDLARESGLSLYLINRKLYSLQKIKVSQFIREVRLKRAMELLKNGTFTASVVSYKVGFGSPAYFNKCFKEFFGCTPGEVKKANINGETHDLIDSISADESGLSKNSLRRFHISVLVIILVIIVIGISGFLVYNKLYRTGSGYSPVFSSSRMSLAVMPFRNMTGDTLLNLWEEGI
jgi:AraC-like DNA-binding protein